MTRRINTPYRDRYPKADGKNVAAMPGVNLDEAVGPSNERESEELLASISPALPADEKKVWRYLGPVLTASNRLNSKSRDLFAEYCYLVVSLNKLKKELRIEKRFTYTTDGRHGAQRKKLPQVEVMKDFRAQMLQICAHFGLTPGTEGRVYEVLGSNKGKGATGQGQQQAKTPFAKK